LRYYPYILGERLRKTTKRLSQDSLSPGRCLNPGPSKYDSGNTIKKGKAVPQHTYGGAVKKDV
jgi:hypothetical protein